MPSPASPSAAKRNHDNTDHQQRFSTSTAGVDRQRTDKKSKQTLETFSAYVLNEPANYPFDAKAYEARQTDNYLLPENYDPSSNTLKEIYYLSPERAEEFDINVEYYACKGVEDQEYKELLVAVSQGAGGGRIVVDETQVKLPNRNDTILISSYVGDKAHSATLDSILISAPMNKCPPPEATTPVGAAPGASGPSPVGSVATNVDSLSPPDKPEKIDSSAAGDLQSVGRTGQPLSDTLEKRSNKVKNIDLDKYVWQVQESLRQDAVKAGLIGEKQVAKGDGRYYLSPSSGLRSYEEQKAKYESRLGKDTKILSDQKIGESYVKGKKAMKRISENQWVLCADGKETKFKYDLANAADKIARVEVAFPGKGPHETGKALDVVFGVGFDINNTVKFKKENPLVKWWHENAPKYGLWNYSQEFWHFELSNKNREILKQKEAAGKK